MMTTTNASTHNNMNVNEQLLLSPFDIDVNDQLFDSPMFTNHSNNNHNSNPNNLQLLSPLLLSPHHGEGFDGLFNDIIHNNNHSYYHHQDPYHHKDGAANVNAVMAANHPTPTDTTVYDQNDFLSQYLTSSSSSCQDSMNRWHNSDPPPLPQLMDSPTTSQPQAAAPIRPGLMRLEVNTQFDETQKAKRVITSTNNTTSTTTSNNNNTQKNNTKKTTTSVVAVQEEEDNETEEGMEVGSRGWQTVFVDPKYANSISIELSSKTRCEEPCSEVPSKMYSSLKYEIRHHATGELCDQVAFLLARISVVDSVNFEEIKKDNRPVLKGVVESALTKPPGDTKSQQKLYGVLKCQFTDVSYHHKKRDFCWQIGLFRPDDLESPIMILRSAPYKVFARKPATNKKRKRETITTTMKAENDSSFTSTSAASSSTSSNNANGWDQFQNRLDDLFRDAKRMKVDDKRKVVGMLCEKMMALDGALFSQTVMNLQQQFSVVEEAQD